MAMLDIVNKPMNGRKYICQTVDITGRFCWSNNFCSNDRHSIIKGKIWACFNAVVFTIPKSYANIPKKHQPIIHIIAIIGYGRTLFGKTVADKKFIIEEMTSGEADNRNNRNFFKIHAFRRVYTIQ